MPKFYTHEKILNPTNTVDVEETVLHVLVGVALQHCDKGEASYLNNVLLFSDGMLLL